jgi:hypothetical protein
MLVWGLKCVAYPRDFMRDMMDKLEHWSKIDQGSKSQTSGSKTSKPVGKGKAKETVIDGENSNSLEEERVPYSEESSIDQGEPIRFLVGGGEPHVYMENWMLGLERYGLTWQDLRPHRNSDDGNDDSES